MDNGMWWETTHIDGFVNEILKLSVQARLFYLKIDLKTRIKRFILFHEDFIDVVNIWKRLDTIRDNFGKETGGALIQQVYKELSLEFSNPELTESVIQKVNQLRENMNDNSIKLV